MLGRGRARAVEWQGAFGAPLLLLLFCLLSFLKRAPLVLTKKRSGITYVTYMVVAPLPLTFRPVHLRFPHCTVCISNPAVRNRQTSGGLFDLRLTSPLTARSPRISTQPHGREGGIVAELSLASTLLSQGLTLYPPGLARCGSGGEAGVAISLCLHLCVYPAQWRRAAASGQETLTRTDRLSRTN